jgi:hypothetical protein
MSAHATHAATTPIPVQLSEPEFTTFIFPHLSMPKYKSPVKRGGKPGQRVADGSEFLQTTTWEDTMQGRHSAIHITIDDHTRATLCGWLRRHTTPVSLAKRARAILV